MATPNADLTGKATPGDLGGTAGVALISGIVLADGVTGPQNDFGLLAPATISGNVYSDLNDDGIEQVGENGITGVAISLTGTDDQNQPVSLSTTTAPDGSYSFSNLRPGTYTIAATTPEGDLTGKSTAGSAGGTGSSGKISEVVLSSGLSSVSNNFGVLTPASISGYVYNDVNDDGIKQTTESGIGSVTVTLTGTDDDGNSVDETAKTSADGAYAFGDLRPGHYQLNATTPTGLLIALSTAGSQGGRRRPVRLARST